MSEFKEIQKQLNQQRDVIDSLQKEYFLEKERQKKLKVREEELKRYYDPENPKHQSLKNQLEEQKTVANQNLQESKQKLSTAKTNIKQNWKDFLPATDPRENLDKLDDKFPILMLPLRMETRFKKVREDNTVVDQLWVRVFPDDCAIDTFEEALSDPEIKNAQDFWADWWIAAGRENGRRGAWRGLVDSHGAGRAQYIFNNYKPLYPEDETVPPEEGAEEQVHLIIPSEEELPNAERDAIKIYWEAVWRAHGDPEKINTAYENLENAVGANRAPLLVDSHVPKNIGDDFPANLDRDTAIVDVRMLYFPSIDNIDTQQETWSNAPRVRLMPERLVLLGYRNNIPEIKEIGAPIPFPLIVGPNPQAEPHEQIELEQGKIIINKDMHWMIDFEEAEKIGMAFRVKLTPAQLTTGFDRLIVLGVKISADSTKGRESLEELIDHHYFGNSGFSFLPVGTPTNNTDNTPSGHSDSEDADESYNLLFVREEEEPEPEILSWWSKTDRHWFADMLGISPDVFKDTINTDGKDQREARAMNTALWPATWGYFFESMMQPIFKEKQIEQLRWFFVNFVVGRGTVPCIRIDDQPYGILPTTVFSRIKWFREEFPRPHGIAGPKGLSHFISGLYDMFVEIQKYWKQMGESVSYVGKEGKPHHLLLDIIGLHGGSVEFYKRFGESLNHIFNLYNLSRQKKDQDKVEGAGNGQGTTSSPFAHVTLEQAWKALFYSKAGFTLLRNLGYTKEEWPEILEKLFVLTPEKLTGDLIDDQPLSETNPIRPYTDGANPINYLEWLVTTAQTSFDRLRREQGFKDNIRPNALLYLMLRHALELGYWDTSLQLYQENQVMEMDQLRMARIEPDFVHIREVGGAVESIQGEMLSSKPLDYPFPSESKYYHLYKAEPAITNSNTKLVVDYIPEILKTHWAARYLWDQVKALKHLVQTPTARLERTFVEHIDCASYRFDAWKAGLVNYQLAAMRYRSIGEDGISPKAEEGLYIGAYGWLENVRSEDKKLTPLDFDQELIEIFQPTDESPILKDNTNAGYINAPSLTHAVTAAILRNGYITKATKQDPNIFSINLSSERVRKALWILEGIRNGQSLAALLGYQLERGIHDKNENDYVDQYIYIMRRKFPLVANHLKSTKEKNEDTPIEAMEARNVVDGLELIKFVESRLDSNGAALYFSELGLDSIADKDKKIIEDEINNIRDMNDAVADLGMAESIHQVVQGNIDRAAGSVETYSKGNYPQVPDVIQTPRSGVNVTHRVGLQIKANADPSIVDYTPRAMAEPGLNLLLQDLLPDLANIICTVSFFHSASNSEIKDLPVSMSELGLEPIDLLYIISAGTDQAMDTLDDLVVHHIRTNYPDPANPDPPRLDADIGIKYFSRADKSVSVFEITPLINHLKALLLRSRPLQPSDIIISNEAKEKVDLIQGLDKQRLDLVLAYLNPHKSDLDTFVSTLETSLGEGGDDDATIINNIDNSMETLVDIFMSLGATGLPQTGIGFAHEWRQTQLTLLYKEFQALIQRWSGKLADFTQLMQEYAGLTNDDEKFELLSRAEYLVSTELTPDPGSDPDVFRALVENKKNDFETRKLEFDAFIIANHQWLSDALTQAVPLLDYEGFNGIATDISKIEKVCLVFARDLLTKARLVQADLTKRLSAVADLFNKYNTEADPKKQIKLLQEIAKKLLSEDFRMIPFFQVPKDQAYEWKKALVAEDQLLAYQTGILKNPLPVDDWFYGVARVREKMGHLEQMIQLAEGFTKNGIELRPVQLPYQEPYCWFALEFGADTKEKEKALNQVFQENDHLLYTAYYHEPFDADKKQCGILIDEWTEVIPTQEETTGIAFHYDRPNSEPPQTFLLVTPPQFRGYWLWQDLVDALHETLDEAKLRAVEPEQIDKTGLATFLPATISTVTKSPISIMMNYALNNMDRADNQTENNG
jgi:hypothetical protein